LINYINKVKKQFVEKMSKKLRRLRKEVKKQTLEIRDLNSLLDYEEKQTPARAAFANISRQDVNKLWWENNCRNKKANRKARKDQEKIMYNRRAEEDAFRQQKIQRKIRELHSIPHMTKTQHDAWLQKTRTRKIYTDADIPDKLRGQHRKQWLEHKNMKQKLYLQGDSGYDRYVDRSLQLDQQYDVSKAYRYNWKIDY